MSFAKITFHPQVWVNDNCLEVDPEGQVSWLVESSIVEGLEDDTYQSDELRLHVHAPDWVKAWTGPFYCSIEPDFLECDGCAGLFHVDQLDSRFALDENGDPKPDSYEGLFCRSCYGEGWAPVKHAPLSKVVVHVERGMVTGVQTVGWGDVEFSVIDHDCPHEGGKFSREIIEVEALTAEQMKELYPVLFSEEGSHEEAL